MKAQAHCKDRTYLHFTLTLSHHCFIALFVRVVSRFKGIKRIYNNCFILLVSIPFSVLFCSGVSRYLRYQKACLQWSIFLVKKKMVL